MIPALFIIVNVLANAGSGDGSVQKSAKRSDQPPYEFVIEVDGKPMDVTAGVPFVVNVDGRVVKMRLAAKPYRTFKRGGIQFQFAATDSYSTDTSQPGMIQWSINGDNKLISVFKFANTKSEEMLNGIVSSILKEYKQHTVRSELTSIMLAGKKYPGIRMIISMFGQKLQQELFGIPTSDSSIVLLIQDSLSDNGTMTEETRQGKKLLMDTFRFTE